MKTRAFISADARPELLGATGTAPAGEAELVLPAARVLFARLRLPRVNAATIRELLPFAVEDRLVADPAHIHAVAGTSGANGETVVAVVDRDWFQAALDAAEHAGLRVREAWCETALLDSAEGEWHLVWGPHHGLVADDDGVGVAFDRAGSDMPLALRIALDEAAARGRRPARVIVHAAQESALPDLARWQQESGVGFAAGAAWEALRSRERGAHAIDLLRGEFSRRDTLIARAKVPRAALALAAAIALVHLALLAIDTARLDAERRSLEGEREALFRSTFPEARVVVDPELQMARNVAELRRTRGLAADDDFLAQLTQAARGAAGPVAALDYANGRLQVKGAP
jgi:general secretion pathway protein L